MKRTWIIVAVAALFITGAAFADDATGSDPRSGQTVGSGGATAPAGGLIGSGTRSEDGGGTIGSGTRAADEDGGYLGSGGGRSGGYLGSGNRTSQSTLAAFRTWVLQAFAIE